MRIICAFFALALTLLANAPSHAQTENDSILDMLPAILTGVKKLPRPINFKVALPRITADDEYEIELGRWNIPNNGTQPVATTDRLQAAINWASEQGFGRIILPNGRFLVGKYGNAIYQAGITLPSNVEFVLSSGALLEMATNDKWNYCVIAINGKTDVTVRGGTIKGDKNTHIFTPRAGGGTAHDEGHGICLNGSQRVLIENTRMNNMTGDGVLIVGNRPNQPANSFDITIRNNEISHNRRQGVSVVGGIRVAIESNEIHHIRGTSPQFGVDIEGAGRIDRDILIRRNNFHHNRGGDIVNTSGKNVFILQNTMHQGREGSDFRYIDGPLVTWERTDNVIAQNKITMLNGSVNGRLGYIQYSGGRDNNPQTTYVHDNVCYNCGMYMYRAEGADIRRNKFFGYFLALTDFRNAVLIDNLVTFSENGPRFCWSYRFKNAYGIARGNFIEDRPANIPLSPNRPHTLDCVVRGF